MSDQRVQVYGEWPDQAIWVWYDYGDRVAGFDVFSVTTIADFMRRPGFDDAAIVRLHRRRGTQNTVLNGRMLTNGDVEWREAWLNNDRTVHGYGKDRRLLRQLVDRSGAAIDFLLAIYYQRLAPNDPSDGSQFYRVGDAPRRNPGLSTRGGGRR